MRFMKQLLAFFLVLPLCFALLGCGGKKAPLKELPEQVDIYYFYDEVCGSCDGTEDFDEIAAEQLAEIDSEATPYQVFRINTYESDGEQTYQSILDENGWDKDSISLPVLFVGGKVFSGMDTIEKNLREATLVAIEDLFENQQVYNPRDKKEGSKLFEDYTATSKNSTFIYAYRIVCPYCVDADPTMKHLPDTIPVEGKDTPLDVIYLNSRSGNNSERLTALFDAYGVPDDKRYVPTIFLSESYLSGPDEINAELILRLEDGEGLNFTFPEIPDS